MFDITPVMQRIAFWFAVIYDWLDTHGMQVGDYYVSFFQFSMGIIAISLFIYIFMPWYEDDEED